METLKASMPNYFGDLNSKLQEVAITPDFHRGSSIPIGTVILTKGFIIPQAMGSDINCGMRLYVTDLDSEIVKSKLQELESKIRYVFFEGGRGIGMDKIQREAMLRNGLMGLLETNKHGKGKGIWKYYDVNQEEKDLYNVSENGSYITDKTIGLESYIGTEGLSYDMQVGTIGGGNHFVEVQKVINVIDKGIANAWGIKRYHTVIMIHSGSLSIGKNSSIHTLEIVKKAYPKNLKHPENGVYPLVYSEKLKESLDDFWALTHNAANFAFSNRLFLGLMMKKIFFELFGECSFELLYDAP
ncbi:MAG: RtcB family protein, partial [Oscillospiraceae bacterium]|nr:RtcB family protein [Oscillospiraceae bacterium]